MQRYRDMVKLDVTIFGPQPDTALRQATVMLLNLISPVYCALMNSGISADGNQIVFPNLQRIPLRRYSGPDATVLLY